jgi:hypothetical protein
MIADLTFRNSHPAHTALVLRFTVTLIERHTSEHMLMISFVNGKKLFMKNMTNQCTFWSISPNESSVHDHESLQIGKHCVSFEV